MVAIEVAERVALGALQVLGIHEEHRAHVRRLAHWLVERDAQSHEAIVPALVARKVGRVGLLRVGSVLRRRERARDPKEIAGARELHADPAAFGRRSHEASDKLRPRRIGMITPAAEARPGEREPALGVAHARAHARHGARQAEAPRLLGELTETLVEARHRAQAHDATGRVAPGSAAVGAEYLDPLDRREVDLIEGGPSVGLGLGNAVEQHAHPARRAGVGAVTRAARTETANGEANVAGAVARLREDARHLL